MIEEADQEFVQAVEEALKPTFWAENAIVTGHRVDHSTDPPTEHVRMEFHDKPPTTLPVFGLGDIDVVGSNIAAVMYSNEPPEGVDGLVSILPGPGPVAEVWFTGDGRMTYTLKLCGESAQSLMAGLFPYEHLLIRVGHRTYVRGAIALVRRDRVEIGFVGGLTDSFRAGSSEAKAFLEAWDNPPRPPYWPMSSEGLGYDWRREQARIAEEAWFRKPEEPR